MFSFYWKGQGWTKILTVSELWYLQEWTWFVARFLTEPQNLLLIKSWIKCSVWHGQKGNLIVGQCKVICSRGFACLFQSNLHFIFRKIKKKKSLKKSQQQEPPSSWSHQVVYKILGLYQKVTVSIWLEYICFW